MGLSFRHENSEHSAKYLGIIHETSSPHFQSSNGEAERAIQTVKNMWKRGSDKHLSFLDLNKTPINNSNISPAQFLMGRRPRNLLPTNTEILKPKLDNSVKFKQYFDHDKEKQKFYYDHRRGVEELPMLKPGDHVRVKHGASKAWVPGTVMQHNDKPRSYKVQCGERVYNRNRKHLRPTSDMGEQEAVEGDDKICDDTEEIADESFTIPAEHHYITWSGRNVVPPKRLDL